MTDKCIPICTFLFHCRSRVQLHVLYKVQGAKVLGVKSPRGQKAWGKNVKGAKDLEPLLSPISDSN